MFENDSSLKRLLNTYMDASSYPFQTKEIIADIEFYETELVSKEIVEIYLGIIEEVKKHFKKNENNVFVNKGFIVKKNFELENLETFEMLITFQPIENSI